MPDDDISARMSAALDESMTLYVTLVVTTDEIGYDLASDDGISWLVQISVAVEGPGDENERFPVATAELFSIASIREQEPLEAMLRENGSSDAFVAALRLDSSLAAFRAFYSDAAQETGRRGLLLINELDIDERFLAHADLPERIVEALELSPVTSNISVIAALPEEWIVQAPVDPTGAWTPLDSIGFAPWLNQGAVVKVHWTRDEIEAMEDPGVTRGET